MGTEEREDTCNHGATRKVGLRAGTLQSTKTDISNSESKCPSADWNGYCGYYDEMWKTLITFDVYVQMVDINL